ncbi:MAG: 3-hydroxyacyl-CoA dehydrogenase [Nitratireductor sp.]|nr:3-hydroxyacyl-CoA dehydrogenase [Nitratireductor sp.]
MNGTIQTVCVIGAGTMGSGIAAQVANAGGDVLLLDIASDGDSGGGGRNAVCERALERIAKSDPPLLMRPENLERIAIGNIEDDLDRAGKCDWIVEAIVERLDVKRALYRSLLPHLKEGALVSSNTSTIPIALLMEDMPDALRKRFCITHFFNPVRYMRLLELVRGAETEDAVIETLARYNDEELGKGVVRCADTPGFLGNRVGVFAMQAAIHEAMALGIDIEDADALFGRPMGIPKTGAFGLYDLIGVDLMADVVRSLRSILPQGDPFHEVGAENALINAQIEKGFTGNKGKGGFYARIDGKAMALDLATGAWRPRRKELPELASAGERDGLRPLLEGEGRLAEFAWRVLARILTYSASLVPEVTDTPQDIDDAMKLGYNWVKGPFELIDEIGAEGFAARLEEDGFYVPEFLRITAEAERRDDRCFYRPGNGVLEVRHFDGTFRPVALPRGVVRFHMARRALAPEFENGSASCFRIGDDVLLVEFHTKANALDDAAMAVVRQAAETPSRGVLVHNDAQHFSAGVNLERFKAFIEAEDWQGIDRFLFDFQMAVEAQLYCDKPVVGAPSGLAIGGGYEVLAHCDLVVAHANSVLGLVEAAVGVVPGGGGVKETYWRWYQSTGDWEKAAWNTFNQVGYGQTASSPDLAARLNYFLAGRDRQVMNRDRLVSAGLAAIDDLAPDYAPRQAPVFQLAGADVFAAMVAFLESGRAKGRFMPHDVTVATQIAWIVTGGEDGARTCSERDLFAREREAFIRLARTPQTHARIAGMLSGTGVPRN